MRTPTSFPSSAWERRIRSSASRRYDVEAELRHGRSQAELGNEGYEGLHALRIPHPNFTEVAMQPSAPSRGPTFKTDNLKLAAQGGRPVFAQGPPGWPLHDEDIRIALERA